MTIVTNMGAAMKLNECYDEPAGEKLPPRVRAVDSNGSGGNVDEILKRLGAVEQSMSSIAATIPYLATKTDISKLNEAICSIAAVIPHLATKADLNGEIGTVNVEIISVKAQIYAMETTLIKWMVATAIACTGLAFTIAKFVH